MENSKIKYVVFGLAFNHSFTILDNWGKIVDDMLYKSKYFDTTLFPNISTQYTTERTLHNPDTGEFFQLSANNMVFRYAIRDKFENGYKEFCKKIEEYLIPHIVAEYNLITARLGVVFAQELSEEDLRKFSLKYFNSEISGVTDFRFAQKELTKESRLWYGVGDYLNKVYTFGKMGNDRSFVGNTYDYQLYFNPPRADIRDIDGKFFKEGLESFKRDIIDVKKGF